MSDPATVVDILLVEDNDSDAELCIRALRKHKLANNLVRARDGAEALDMLFSTAPSAPTPKVILLDLRLPKVDGMEVLQRVKADERTRTLPIVVLTSSKEDRDIVEAYHLGVNSFISKPVDFDDFVETVGKLGFYWLVVNRPPA
jgi:CheY-like chemotaxis protein